MSKTVVITQSNYLPWRGYFDLLRSADHVVLLESVQYTRRDWRNRNLIKTSSGTTWLSIAVETKGRFLQAIDETRIADLDWTTSHTRAIELAYRDAAFYRDVSPWLFGLMESVASEPFLSRVNERTIRAICERLTIDVPITRCSDILARAELRGMEAHDRLIRLAKAVGADRYLTGPNARAYLDVERFAAEDIEVLWMAYEGYPDYPQLWGKFEPHVSIVDLLLNTGSAAPHYLTRQ
jgi:WbqC-like protein